MSESRDLAIHRFRVEMERSGQLQAYESEVRRRGRIRELQRYKPLCRLLRRAEAIPEEEWVQTSNQASWRYRELMGEDLEVLTEVAGLEVIRAALILDNPSSLWEGQPGSFSLGLGFRGVHTPKESDLEFMAHSDGAVWVQNIFFTTVAGIDYLRFRDLERAAWAFSKIQKVAKAVSAQ